MANPVARRRVLSAVSGHGRKFRRHDFLLCDDHCRVSFTSGRLTPDSACWPVQYCGWYTSSLDVTPLVIVPRLDSALHISLHIC